MSVLKKIAEVMKEVGYLQKDGKVDFNSTKYKYLSETKITLAIRVSMIKHGLIMYPIEMKEEESAVKTSKGSHIARVFVKYRIQDIDDDSYIEPVSQGYGLDSGDKGIYKAMTGAFKYAQRETFMLSTGDDPDKTSSEEITQTEKITSAQVNTIKSNMKKADVTEERFCEVYKIDSISDLPSAKYTVAVNKLKKTAAEK